MFRSSDFVVNRKARPEYLQNGCVNDKTPISAAGLFDAFCHEHTALLEVDCRVLFLCIGFALCRNLRTPHPIELRVPDLVDPLDPLAPDLGGAFGGLLSSDRRNGGDHKQNCEGEAHSGISLTDERIAQRCPLGQGAWLGLLGHMGQTRQLFVSVSSCFMVTFVTTISPARLYAILNLVLHPRLFAICSTPMEL